MLLLIDTQPFSLPLRTMDIIRSWREQKIFLKRMFTHLTDDDFVYEEGKKESMLDKLCVKLSKTRGELELILAEIQHY